jgi:hypothetical protein
MTCVLGILMRLHDLALYGYPRRRLRQRQCQCQHFGPPPSSLPSPLPSRPLSPLPAAGTPCFNFQARRRVCPQSRPFPDPSHLLFPFSSAPFEHQYFIFILSLIYYSPFFSSIRRHRITRYLQHAYRYSSSVPTHLSVHHP